MGVVPTLKESCFCCTLKTGSFVTAWFLLVGASVQLGYYTFLVDHIHPQKLCNYTELIRVKVDPSEYAGHDYDHYDRYGPDDYYDDNIYRWIYGPPPREKNRRPQGWDAANTTHGKKKNSTNTTNPTVSEQTNSSYTANTTVGEPTNSSNALNTRVGEPTNSSNAADTTVGKPTNSSNTANTAVGEPTNSSNAANTVGEPANLRNEHNTTVGEPTNSSNAVNTTVSEPTNSSNTVNTTVGKPTNSSVVANTRVGQGEPTNSKNAVRNDATVSNRRSSWGRRRHGVPLIPWGWPFGRFSPYGGGWTYKESIYQRPCPRDYKPFDADSGLLDFDMRGSGKFDKNILYFNIGVWGILMVVTIPLMVAVYMDSACLVGAWLVVETLLMAVAAASMIATAAAMFRVVPVQIGIVTLINMAIHLGINSYMMMVVYNYRRQLLGKLKDDDEEEDQQVIVGADNLAVEHV